MTPDQFYELLMRRGVYRLQWRDEIVDQITLTIGNAQVRAAIFGFVAGAVLTTFVMVMK